jgi:hypothetical protein
LILRGFWAGLALENCARSRQACGFAIFSHPD